jgi:N-dimethylarginine dimethylaminohydrolase
MCPPTYFGIEYKINPWMQGKVDRKKAQRQWETLKRTFKKLGMEVSLIQPVKYLPDMVFTADQGAIYDHIFIKSNFRNPERARESLYTLDWFKKRGFTIVELPEGVYFEGQGDLLFFDSRILIGVGQRTNLRAARIIGSLLREKPLILHLKDPFFYHLDTALCVLPSQNLMVYERAFDESSLNKIRKLAKHIVSLSKHDASLMACNALVYKNSIVISKGCSQGLLSNLRRLGMRIFEVELSEFLKSGGGARGLTWEG